MSTCHLIPELCSHSYYKRMSSSLPPWKWSGLYKQNEGQVAPYNFQCWTIKGDRASAWVSLSLSFHAPWEPWANLWESAALKPQGWRDHRGTGMPQDPHESSQQALDTWVSKPSDVCTLQPLSYFSWQWSGGKLILPSLAPIADPRAKERLFSFTKFRVLSRTAVGKGNTCELAGGDFFYPILFLHITNVWPFMLSYPVSYW